MQYLKDRGFVIRRVNFGDSDRYVTLFTQNHGKVELVAKGVRKITSRRTSSMELLNLVNFQAVRTSKNFILTEVVLLDSFQHLKQELAHIQKVFLMCELIEAALPHGSKHADVFDLMLRAAEKVSENEKNMAYFQAKLLSLLGFWDGTVSFKNDDHVQRIFEQVIERKLKSPTAFTVGASV